MFFCLKSPTFRALEAINPANLSHTSLVFGSSADDFPTDLRQSETDLTLWTHLSKSLQHISSGWWFGIVFIFPHIGNNHPNISELTNIFRGVETTNQSRISICPHFVFDCFRQVHVELIAVIVLTSGPMHSEPRTSNFRKARIHFLSFQTLGREVRDSSGDSELVLSSFCSLKQVGHLQHARQWLSVTISSLWPILQSQMAVIRCDKHHPVTWCDIINAWSVHNPCIITVPHRWTQWTDPAPIDPSDPADPSELGSGLLCAEP